MRRRGLGQEACDVHREAGNVAAPLVAVGRAWGCHRSEARPPRESLRSLLRKGKPGDDAQRQLDGGLGEIKVGTVEHTQLDDRHGLRS